MNEQVASELELIPRGGFEQNELRMLYQMERSRALGVNSEEYLTPAQVLDRATAMVRETAPEFEPGYDSALLDLP